MRMTTTMTSRAVAPILWCLVAITLAACDDGDDLTGAGFDPTPRLSNHVVFATIEGDTDSDIHAIDLDTNTRIVLTGGPENDSDPAVSPDGSQIAFSRRIRLSDGSISDQQIYLMNADGSDVRPITAMPGFASRPAWSPDGRQIAFTGSGDADAWSMEIWVMDADGSNVTQLTTGSSSASSTASYSPAWSPDGSKIAYVFAGTGGSKILVMNSDGSDPVDLLGQWSQWADGPAWSPDGSQIAYGKYFDGKRVIAKMGADGGNQVILTAGGQDYHPTWSPDGSSIAYAGRATTPDSSGSPIDNSEIMVVSANGGTAENITLTETNERHPNWSQRR